jgi:hypothetical protein
MDREKILRALIDWNFWYKEQFTAILEITQNKFWT